MPRRSPPARRDQPAEIGGQGEAISIDRLPEKPGQRSAPTLSKVDIRHGWNVGRLSAEREPVPVRLGARLTEVGELFQQGGPGLELIGQI